MTGNRTLDDRIKLLPDSAQAELARRLPRGWGSAPQQGHDLELPDDQVLAFAFAHALADTLRAEPQLNAQAVDRAEARACGRVVAERLARLHARDAEEAFDRVRVAASKLGLLLSGPPRARPRAESTASPETERPPSPAHDTDRLSTGARTVKVDQRACRFPVELRVRRESD